MSTLRPYQIEGINKIFRSWRAGKRSVLFQMPTGTGKTVLFSEIVKMGFEKQRKILIAVHRIELIDQITKKLNEKGINVGHIVAGKNTDYSKIIQVASIQTLSRRERPDANLIIIDECHHAKAASYKKLWALYPHAKFLGVTATPIRLSGEGFDDIFDELILSMSTSRFIEEGYLVPISHYVQANPDLSNVKTSKGDYVTKMLSNVMMDNRLMMNLVDSYKEKCNGKTAIVFAVDVEHSKDIAYRFNSAGIIARHVDAKTPANEREQILKDFKSGRVKVISNVEIITEGFDFPECQVVQLARPTKSLALYLQMIGRVMRPAQGKNEGVVLDNAGLWLEHGLSDADRIWSLKGKKKRRNIPREFNELAIDDEGVIREVSRFRPEEVNGLKLIPMTEEFRRLIIFEDILKIAIQTERKLLYPYFQYIKYLIKIGQQKLTKIELEYIKKRLNYYNQEGRSLPEKRFKPGFWMVQQKYLTALPTLESLDGTYVSERDKTLDYNDFGDSL